MPDRIALLPDNLANQIAAGEVIQRPASAVKELLENAIDAGADQIHLILRDAGKELIQVIDNGRGMSPIDARLCFERHATSKIKSIDDLFAIRTMGFRGEALASIAAVAQVVLKTRTAQDETGTEIHTDNSIIRSQEICQTPVGCQISVRNLFFNVPARRSFLKGNPVELKHIMEEFTRIALAYPDIAFRMTHQDRDQFQLERSKLKPRILAVLGNTLESRLVPVSEETDFLQISGFVGTPEATSRSRGQQYFFVNQRYIRSPYLAHAVSQAYHGLIGADEFPFFLLRLDIDPKRVDVNVHPTKQEIKFEDDRLVYSVIQAAVKHALSKFSVAPSLDFNLDAGIEGLSAVTQPFTTDKQDHTRSEFLFQSFTQRGQAHRLHSQAELQAWRTMHEDIADTSNGMTSSPLSSLPEETAPKLDVEDLHTPAYLQIGSSHILVTTRNGFLLIDQQLAHQRIRYEKLALTHAQAPAIQQCLIPITLHFDPTDAVMFEELLPELNQLGYQVEAFGQHTFIVQGIPADVAGGQEKETLEKLLDAFKLHASDWKTDKREQLVRCLAKQEAISRRQKLTLPEMEKLMADLFRCEQPQYTSEGKKIFVKLSTKEIDALLDRPL